VDGSRSVTTRKPISSQLQHGKFIRAALICLDCLFLRTKLSSHLRAHMSGRTGLQQVGGSSCRPNPLFGGTAVSLVGGDPGVHMSHSLGVWGLGISMATGPRGRSGGGGPAMVAECGRNGGRRRRRLPGWWRRPVGQGWWWGQGTARGRSSWTDLAVVSLWVADLAEEAQPEPGRDGSAAGASDRSG
jgi:hypothetical protein